MTQQFLPLSMYPKEMKISCHTKTCKQMFVAAFFLIASKWKQSDDGCIKKMWHVHTMQYYSAIKSHEGLPWWLSGREFTCQCRRHRFDPRSGKIPLATEKLSPRARTTEARAPWNPCSTTRYATAMRSPSATAKEQPVQPGPAQSKTLNTNKLKILKRNEWLIPAATWLNLENNCRLTQARHKRPDTLCDSIYMTCPEQANP